VRPITPSLHSAALKQRQSNAGVQNFARLATLPGNGPKALRFFTHTRYPCILAG
jgi:hypothetical protein